MMTHSDIQRPILSCFSLLFTLLCCQLAPIISVRVQAAELNQITAIQIHKETRPQRIQIGLRSAVSLKSAILAGNPATATPYRLYIDLLDTVVPSGLQKNYSLDAGPVERMRVAQNSPSAARIVFDCSSEISLRDVQIIQLANPAKVIIILPDIKSIGQADTRHIAAAARAEPEPLSSRETCVIVIDPGHGGKDPGAIGHNGIMEKDVCLALALRLRQELQKHSDCRAVLTRETDVFVPLDERSRIANQHRADLFISIHANSHDDTTLTGIETYYLNFSSDDTARKVAARENFTTPDKIGDLELILFDLTQSDKINRSSLLAGHVHNAIVERVISKYDDIRNLGVKHAPMRVLIDPEMPCILIEAAFISNPKELVRLQNSSFQQRLAQAIHLGMRDFLSKQETALLR